jgi:hypothetical protein
MRRVSTVIAITLVTLGTGCGDSGRTGNAPGIDATTDGTATIDDAAPLPAGACYTVRGLRLRRSHVHERVSFRSDHAVASAATFIVRWIANPSDR